jgi:predicted enzyme related to lactoylglutathione lyase
MPPELPMPAGTIIHFEILSTQFERSANFYAEVFGWKADEAQTGGHRGFQVPAGPSGSWVLQALAQVSGPVPFVGVDDLDAALAAIEKAGGRALVRRQSLGARGTGALFVDPDGNVMGLLGTSAVPSATGTEDVEPSPKDPTVKAPAKKKEPAKPRATTPEKKKKSPSR